MITCGPYICRDTLGKGGYATVKLAEHSETGQICALKIMRRKNSSDGVDEIVKNEISVMKELSHQNIIKILDYSDKADYTLPDGRSMEVYYLALEIASNGEIFDVLAETGRFSESLARFYFHQLVDSLEYMHTNGIFHRDIKPENILLDSEFNCKLTDFGFASPEKVSTVKKGTTSYMAPEMFSCSEFKVEPLDIFALGAVLFIMIKAAPAFCVAKPADKHYQLFVSNNKMFWKVHFRRFKDYTPSEELVELISRMMDYDADRRITLEEIKQSKWYNLPLPTKEEVVAEMTSRKQQAEGEVEMDQ